MGKQYDHPMSREEYRAALKEFGLTQGRASWLFGGKSRTSGRRWAAEGVPYHVALIITIMREYRLTPKDIEKLGARWRKRKRRPHKKTADAYKRLLAEVWKRGQITHDEACEIGGWKQGQYHLNKLSEAGLLQHHGFNIWKLPTSLSADIDRLRR